MIPIALVIIATCILSVEFWTGMAVVGWSGDNTVIDRKKSPGPYWFTMVIHTAFGLGIPVLLLLAN